jgi:hypothetical protein
LQYHTDGHSYLTALKESANHAGQYCQLDIPSLLLNLELFIKASVANTIIHHENLSEYEMPNSYSIDIHKVTSAMISPQGGDKGDAVGETGHSLEDPENPADSGFVMVGYLYGDPSGESTTERRIYYTW